MAPPDDDSKLKASEESLSATSNRPISTVLIIIGILFTFIFYSYIFFYYYLLGMFIFKDVICDIGLVNFDLL